MAVPTVATVMTTPTGSIATTTPAAVPTVATATPIVLTRQEPGDTNRPVTASCSLVTRQDMGGLFAAEVNQPIYHANATSVLPFSDESVSADEYNCIYLAFHNPGSASGSSYQVTYWVDMPGQTPASQWAQVWSDAKARAAQVIAGIGDDAFYQDGRLTFKKGDTYMTIEVLGTKLDTATEAGVNQQIDIEKKVALKALSRWK